MSTLSQFNEFPKTVDINAILAGNDSDLKKILVRRGIMLDCLVMDEDPTVVSAVLGSGFDVRSLGQAEYDY